MKTFDQYILQNIQKEDINFESSQETKEELMRIDQFLEESDDEKQQDQTTILMNQINTLIGYLSQMALKSNHPYLTHFVQDIMTHQKTYIEELNQARQMEDEQALLQTLEALNVNVSDYYTQTKNQMIESVKTSLSTIEERESLLKEVEKMVAQVEQYAETTTQEDQKEVLKSLAELYVKAMQEDIQTFEGLSHEVALLKDWKTNATPILEKKEEPQIPLGPQENLKSFSLFENIDEKIVDFQSLQENGKTYVKYTLQDGSYYFAVVEGEEQVKESYKSFEQNAHLLPEQTKEAWRKNLEIIVFCLQTYYVINEYVRYQEISHRSQEKDALEKQIHPYKEMLTFMEEKVLKPYLEYADGLSKQALIGDNAATTFYEQASSQEVTRGKIQNLVVSVLGNKDAKKEILTQDILETLYPIKEEDYLAKISQQATPLGHEMQEIALTEVAQTEEQEEKNEEIPIVSNEETPPIIPDVSKVQPTNYDKMEQYMNKRKEDILAPLKADETAMVSSKETDSLYEDLNLYLDLEEAEQITNKVYQAQNPLQGTNAKMAFLKDANIGGFTSKYHARELASQVDRDEYFYQMLVQTVKDYATFNEQRKKNPSFGEGIENLFSLVGQAVLEERFDVNQLVNNILEDDTMLTALSKNFDGRYLIPDKGDEPLFQTVLQDYERGNPLFADKVKLALASLRDQFQHEAYQVPTKNQLTQIQIPSGKLAA